MLVPKIVDGYQCHRLDIETGIHIGLQYVYTIEGFSSQQQPIEIAILDGTLNALLHVLSQFGLRQIFAGKGYTIRQRDTLLLEHRIEIILLHG